MRANEDGRSVSRGGIRARWVFAAFLVIAAYLLIAEHTAHLSVLLGYLPFLLLLACPFMHLFRHRGHDQHRSNSDRKHTLQAGEDK